MTEDEREAYVRSLSEQERLWLLILDELTRLHVEVSRFDRRLLKVLATLRDTSDFTEVVYDGGRRKAQLMAVLDLESRYVVGWAVGRSANRDLALRCWDEVRSGMAAFGCALEGRIIHHDQDSVYTSYQWLRTVL